MFFYFGVSYGIIGVLLCGLGRLLALDERSGPAVVRVSPLPVDDYSLKARVRNGQKRLAAFWVITAALLMLPFFPYVRVAYLTAKYKDMLMPAVAGLAQEQAWTKENPIHIVRVLAVSDRAAQVYVVGTCHGGMTAASSQLVGLDGWVLRAMKTSEGWRYQSHDIVWSDCGSAEGNIFPPYLEAREF